MPQKVWNDTRQGAGNVVAVIDSGCQIDYLDLKDNIVGRYNFTDDDQGNPSIFYDYVGYGTHVFGIIAAINNDVGVVDVAPKYFSWRVSSSGRNNIGLAFHSLG
ncbi:S8 family serine peptidase [Radiobacillus deserti]|uniref:Peptidase S8/S53 domain-containing protein n=1 Tax=Radiobacillus deserti TaxID=2594883 RepID=A0A516KDK6_9BACI|nr:S8 family serine peptidase [Radiobacillus deserti]QDP39479.1 hypothetical protein FN924_04385 [Radiobacillus deserti]